MEFIAGASTVCVARVRPSGRVSVVNSTSAERSGVKSPLRIAFTRCHRPAGRTRLTAPCATVPAGTTSRSKANTGSITFASTGAPRRLGRRLVKYTRNGAPGRTWIEIFRLSSSAAGAADAEKTDTHATRKHRRMPIDHLLGLIISPAPLDRFGGGVPKHAAKPQNGDCHQFPPLELVGCTRFAYGRYSASRAPYFHPRG